MGEPHHFQKTAKAVGSFQQLLKVLYLEVTQHQHTEIPLDTGLRKTFMKMDQLHLLYLTHIICLTEITADKRNKVLVYQSTLRKSYKKLLWQPEIWSETHKNGKELHILLSWESQEEKDLKQRIFCVTSLSSISLTWASHWGTAPHPWKLAASSSTSLLLMTSVQTHKASFSSQPFYTQNAPTFIFPDFPTPRLRTLCQQTQPTSLTLPCQHAN